MHVYSHTCGSQRTTSRVVSLGAIVLFIETGSLIAKPMRLKVSNVSVSPVLAALQMCAAVSSFFTWVLEHV